MKSLLELIKEIARVKEEIAIDTERMKLKHSKLNLNVARYEEEMYAIQFPPQGVWKPKEGERYYFVAIRRAVDYHINRKDIVDKNILANHNFYKTQGQVAKASVLTRQASRIIQACINFDPDFMPDWMSAERKYSVGYYLNEKRWIVNIHIHMDTAVAYVSSTEIAQSICDLFNNEDTYSE